VGLASGLGPVGGIGLGGGPIGTGRRRQTSEALDTAWETRPGLDHRVVVRSLMESSTATASTGDHGVLGVKFRRGLDIVGVAGARAGVLLHLRPGDVISVD